MKITKSQLKQIIKEELAEATSRIVSPMTGEEHWVEDEEKTSDQMVIEQVKEVTKLFADMYNGLSDDESKELFEHWLNTNVRLYTEEWQKERQDPRGPAGGGLGGPGPPLHGQDVPGFGEELP